MKIVPSKPGNKPGVTFLTALLALVFFTSANTASAEVLSPFQASYSVARGSLTLGETDFSLSPQANKPGCYLYHGTAKPRTILRLIVGDITDDSYFCVDDKGALQSQRFSHIEEGNDEDTHTLKFDWDAQKVTYIGQNAKNGTLNMQLPDEAVDPFGLHMAARLWLAQMQDATQPAEREFVIIDEHEIKRYTVATSPGGVVKTPFGSFDTIKLARIDDPKKQLILWIAPELDFMPIKVESKKRDDPVIRMKILSLKRDVAATAQSN